MSYKGVWFYLLITQRFGASGIFFVQNSPAPRQALAPPPRPLTMCKNYRFSQCQKWSIKCVSFMWFCTSKRMCTNLTDTLESTKIIFLSTLSIIAFILPFAKCRYELNFVWVSSAKHSRPCSAFCSPRHPWLVVLTHIKIKFCDTRRTFKSGNYY